MWDEDDDDDETEDEERYVRNEDTYNKPYLARINTKRLSLYKALVIELERAQSEKDPKQIEFLKSHIALLDGLTD